MVFLIFFFHFNDGVIIKIKQCSLILVCSVDPKVLTTSCFHQIVGSAPGFPHGIIDPIEVCDTGFIGIFNVFSFIMLFLFAAKLFS